MPSPKAARTTRRILKLASLGIAGLLVGLLSGCTSAPTSSNVATYTQPSTLDFNSTAHQPLNPFIHPVPDLKHPPAPHKIESWADRTPRPVSAFPIQGDADPTFTNYAFTSIHTPPNPGASHLSVQ